MLAPQIPSTRSAGRRTAEDGGGRCSRQTMEGSSREREREGGGRKVNLREVGAADATAEQKVTSNRWGEAKESSPRIDSSLTRLPRCLPACAFLAVNRSPLLVSSTAAFLAAASIAVSLRRRRRRRLHCIFRRRVSLKGPTSSSGMGGKRGESVRNNGRMKSLHHEARREEEKSKTMADFGRRERLTGIVKLRHTLMRRPGTSLWRSLSKTIQANKMHNITCPTSK